MTLFKLSVKAPEIPEAIWKKAEQNIVRRERVDRIRRGVIVPVHRGLPNVMARDADGRWWPNANFVKEN